MREFLKPLLDAFKTPSVSLGNGVRAIHQDYKIDDREQPYHFKAPLARHVVSQSIINKDDFIAFVTEYKTDATKLFYDDGKVKAVFNYITASEPDYGDSTALMPLIQTDDYKHYRSNNGRSISQKDFIRLLKRMEPYIVALDNKKADDMDIIEMAESLQGITTIDSIQRNASNKFSIDATVRTGKANVEIPRIITFEFPIYTNDRELTTRFETELFLSAQDGAFVAELICYNIDQLEEETRRQLTQSICDGIEGVKAFQV
ncbi:MAG: DUF2303 family protein [Sulfuricurvum sp.]|nr:DUF2303 family protein [Sulfuricurvum sp.]